MATDVMAFVVVDVAVGVGEPPTKIRVLSLLASEREIMGARVSAMCGLVSRQQSAAE